MLGDFIFCNPTRIYFGKNSLSGLDKELPMYGKTVMLIYGKGSVKKSGLYDKVTALLKAHGKTVVEDGGVMPNPTLDKLCEGMRIAREAKADLILAVGGGSVCDYAKAVSVSAYCDEDPWEKYYIRSSATTSSRSFPCLIPNLPFLFLSIRWLPDFTI